jgi:hypothetical protein
VLRPEREVNVFVPEAGSDYTLLYVDDLVIPDGSSSGGDNLRNRLTLNNNVN